MKIVLDSACSFKYASLYIKGFMDLFGKKNVSYQAQPFIPLKSEKRNVFDQYLACKISGQTKEYNIIIDYRDNGTIDRKAYHWCDLYCKINFDAEEATGLNKIFKIAPNFDIRIYNTLLTFYHAGTNFLKAHNYIPDKKLFFGGYIRNYQREVITEYEKKEEIIPRYIFSASTLWKHDNCLTGTNPNRAAFFRACKASYNIDFEGGFYLPNNSHPQYDLFKDIIMQSPVSQSEYLKKTKQSILVFNTPAVFNCHGWKLGEYLAMGKAIISTPLYYELPEPLVHGENIHFIKSIDEINETIDILLNDEKYRKKLETGASAYYEKYVKPYSAIKNIVDKLQLQIG